MRHLRDAIQHHVSAAAALSQAEQGANPKDTRRDTSTELQRWLRQDPSDIKDQMENGKTIDGDGKDELKTLRQGQGGN